MGSRKQEADRWDALGRALRDLVLRVRIAANPHHDQPGWSELDDYSRATWARVARAIIEAGWTPPGEK